MERAGDLPGAAGAGLRWQAVDFGGLYSAEAGATPLLYLLFFFFCFEWFGGVPAEVLVDNQKCAVLAHPARTVGSTRALWIWPATTASPRGRAGPRARTKGKDERMVGYIKHHFFVRYRAFDSWAHLNQLAEQWLREEADQRVHGTVHEVVAERFAREQPQLQPLPATRYDTSYWELRQVSWDAYIEVRGNRYSVPDTLAGRGASPCDPWTGTSACTTASSASPSISSEPAPRAG